MDRHELVLLMQERGETVVDYRPTRIIGTKNTYTRYRKGIALDSRGGVFAWYDVFGWTTAFSGPPTNEMSGFGQ